MNEYAPCPSCGNSNAQQLKFTWWGGVLGPKLLHHVKCNSCNVKYNGKSGKSNTTNIIIYAVVLGVIGFALVFALMIFVALMGNR